MAATKSTATATTREERGYALFRDYSGEIWRVEPYLYRVPSCSGNTVYLVTTKRGAEYCPCPDFEYRGSRNGSRCKHLEAALIFRSKSGECASCKTRVLRRELVEVVGDHPIFFVADELCGECAKRHGIR